MTTQAEHICLGCGTEARLMKESRLTVVGNRSVIVDDEWLRCASCDEDFYTPSQADQLHERAIRQIRLEDGLLPPDAIKELRKRIGLTQRDFERLIGTGEKTCVRWESGRVCQSVAADRLIRLLAANQENVQILAALSGIALRVPDYLSEYGIDNLGFWSESGGVSATLGSIGLQRTSIGGTTEKRDLSKTAEFAAIQSASIPSRKHRITDGALVC